MSNLLQSLTVVNSRRKLRNVITLLLVVMLLTVWVVPAFAGINHMVKKGESLYTISLKYGVTVSEIKDINSVNSNTIYPGQKLIIPELTYTVKRGDTLSQIANKYNIPLINLKSYNGLNKDTIYPGQVIRLPGNKTISASRANSFSQDDLYWLSRAVYGEARGESYQGQVAVAAVILNRLKSDKFPNTIKGIIFERLAFTAVSDGQIYLTPNATAIRAAREAMAGNDPTGGALYYWNPAKATSKWIWSRTIIKKIGNHVFAK